MEEKYFSPDAAIGKLYKRIPCPVKISFFSAVVMGLFTHLYMLTNKFPNPDDTRHMFDLGVSTSGGRFGLDLLSQKWFGLDVSILTAYSMPWLNGLLSIMLIGISAACIVMLFGVKRKVNCALIAMIMVTYPTVTGTLHYMFTAPAYFVALLFSAVSVYAFQKRKWYSVLIGELLLMLCLSIYQAYFWVAIGLSILLCFFAALDQGETRKKPILSIFKDGVFFLAALVGALILYAVTNKLMLRMTGTELVQYGGLNDLFNISGVNLFAYFKLGYQKFFENAWNMVEEGAPYRHCLFLCMIAAAIIQLIVIFGKKFSIKSAQSFGTGAFLAALIFIFPLGAGSIYVASRQFVHSLMMYPSVLNFVFCIVILDRFLDCMDSKKWKSMLYKISAICVLLISINYSVIANAVYLGSQITTSQAMYTLNRLVTRMQLVEDFDINTMPVAFVGSPNDVENPPTLSDLYSLNNVVGVCFVNDPVTGYEENVLINTVARTNFQQMERWLGEKYIVAENGQIEQIMTTEEFAEMSTYPEPGSLRIIDDILVVKFVV